MQHVSLRSDAPGGNLAGDAQLDAYLEAHQQFGPQPGMQDVAPYVQSASLSSRVHEQ
jgi:sigma-E factor negative regulatory protein RseA